MRTRFARLVCPVFLAAVLLQACSLPASTPEGPKVTQEATLQAPEAGSTPHVVHPPTSAASSPVPATAPLPEAGAGNGPNLSEAPAPSDEVRSLIGGLASASDLREVLNLLLTEHVLLEADSSRAILGLNRARYTAAAEALEANSADIAAVLGAIYGSQAGVEFLPDWQEHIGYMVSYTTAVAAHDTARHDETAGLLLGSSEKLGSAFHAMASNLEENTLAGLFDTHLASLRQLIDLHAAGDLPLAYSSLRDARQHMGSIALALAGGIAARFPERFPGEMAAGTSELRSTLTLLLSEHIFLATEATKAALQGQQGEYEAAAEVMELNATDLAAAVGSTYGHDAQAAFLPLWRKHVDYAAEYTTSLAQNDTTGQREALERLLVYPQELGAFFNRLNPSLPVDSLAGLEEDHIRSLIEIIDSQNVGNDAAAFSLLRHAYAHTGMMAVLLAEGTPHTSIPGTGQQAMIQQVEITVFAFSPQEIEIKVGTTVIWTNQDETTHTVTVGSVGNAGSDFDSTPFEKGESFAVLFSEPGEFPYFCRVHPEMVGVVHVVP